MTRTTPLLRFRRILGNLFVALVGAYGLSVSGFLLLRTLLGDDLLVISLVNNFAHTLFMFSLVLIPLCLLLRRVRVIVLLLPPLLAFLLSYALFFVPRATSAAADAPRLSVLTYNLKAQAVNVDMLIAVIRDSGADVIALQELSIPAAARIEVELNALYPHQALHPQPEPAFAGQGLLSRYPIQSDDYWLIHYGHQRVQLDVNGQVLIVYNSHPTPPFFTHDFFSQGHLQRKEEVIDIMRRVQAEPDDVPLVLMGDMNLTDQSTDYWRIAEHLIDTHREVGWGMGFTFPNFGMTNARLSFLPPVARIDYVFHNASLFGVETRILPNTGGSDHFPLYVVLAFGE